MIRLGLCSGACIARDVAGVIAAAARAGLEAIEWDAGVHVAAGDPEAAKEAMVATLAAGLTTASYASIYRAGSPDEGYGRFERLLATAAVLQAPLLRIYAREAAGRLEDFAAELRLLGDKAAERGITLCLSLGKRTALDGYEAARGIVEATGHDFVKLAWEDLPGAGGGEATAALSELGGRAGLLLALGAGRDGRARPLSRDAAAWKERLGAFKRSERDPKMSGFVFLGGARAEGAEGEESLVRDARALREIAEEVDPKPRRR